MIPFYFDIIIGVKISFITERMMWVENTSGVVRTEKKRNLRCRYHSFKRHKIKKKLHRILVLVILDYDLFCTHIPLTTLIAETGIVIHSSDKICIKN